VNPDLRKCLRENTWAHIRTTNAIESTFAALRHRTKRSKGAFSKESAKSMIFQSANKAEQILENNFTLKTYLLM
jgi:transposase-like protein